MAAAVEGGLGLEEVGGEDQDQEEEGWLMTTPPPPLDWSTLCLGINPY